MPAYHRSSSEVERQLADFKSNFPDGIPEPPPGDFAAKLQYKSWRRHLQELEVELDEALKREFHESTTHQAPSLIKMVIGPPATKERHFHRPDVRSLLLRKLERTSVSLEAPRRAGKTSILHNLCDDPGSERKCLLFDVEGVNTVDGFWQGLLSQLRRSGSPSPVWLDPPSFQDGRWSDVFAMQVKAQSSKVFFLVDEFSYFLGNLHRKQGVAAVDAFLAEFRNICHLIEHAGHRFLLSGSTSLQNTLADLGVTHRLNHLDRVAFPPLGIGEAVNLADALARGLGIQADYEALRYLVLKVGPVWPFHLQMFFQEVEAQELHSLTPATIDLVYQWLKSSPMSPMYQYIAELQRYLPDRIDQKVALQTLRWVAESTNDTMEEIKLLVHAQQIAGDRAQRVVHALEQEGFLKTDDGAKRRVGFATNLYRDFSLGLAA